MRKKQPEALRLADALDTDRAWLAKRQLHQQSMSDASAVLRTQHEAIKELREALRSLTSSLNYRAAVLTSSAGAEKLRFTNELVWKCVDVARAALAKHGA